MINFNSSMETLMNGYMQAAKVSVFSKISAVLSTIAILWFGGHILDKADFGLFMIALAYVTLVGMLVAGPFCSVILYHASRLDGEGDESGLGQSMTGRALAWVIFYALSLIGITIFLGEIIGDIFGENGLRVWLIYLSPIIILESLRRVIAIWHRARQDVQISITYNEVWPNMLKILALFVAYNVAPSVEGVSFAMNIALLVPLIMIFKTAPIFPNIGGRIFTSWDIKYGAKNLMTYGLNQQSRGFDLLLVGALAGAVVAADYAIAARLGRFLLIGKQALSQLLAPRLGAFFGQKDKSTAAAEFKIVRTVGVVIAIMGAMGVLLFGEWVTSWFCSSCYNAYPVLLILSGAFIMNTAFGSTEDYMTMAGHAGWNLSLSILSTGIMIALSVLLIPGMGGEGAALAVLTAFVVRGVSMIMAIHRLDGVLLLTRSQMMVSSIISGFLVLLGLSM